MISTNDFRPGLTIELDGDIYQVVESQHVKPGKGPAFVRSKLRNLMTRSIIQKTFRAGEKIPPAHLEKRRMQYLYSDGEDYHFMNVDTYEQMPLSGEQLGDTVKYLKENIEVEVLTFKDRMVGVELPTAVALEVKSTVPGIRGDTVSSGGTKPAVMETGAEILVPLFINEGDVVRVDTRTGQYMDRASSR